MPLADLVVLFHMAFIIFAVVGAVAVLRWPAVAWLHIPCVAWAAMIEFTGWICPLTPLENALRRDGAGYEGGFVDQYILPLIYPPGLTRETQWLLGAAVIAVNLILYTIVFIRRYRQ
jgi:hypothetical protein